MIDKNWYVGWIESGWGRWVGGTANVFRVWWFSNCCVWLTIRVGLLPNHRTSLEHRSHLLLVALPQMWHRRPAASHSRSGDTNAISALTARRGIAPFDARSNTGQLELYSDRLSRVRWTQKRFTQRPHFQKYSYLDKTIGYKSTRRVQTSAKTELCCFL